MNRKTRLIQFYVIEVYFRFFYFFISFFLCIIISFYYIELLLLIETYPFLEFSRKKFIVTHTTDLINMVWSLIISTSFFMVFPTFFYQLIQFSKASWYLYQLKFCNKLFIIPLIIYYFSIIICYFKLFPLLLEFLIQWQLLYSKTFLNIVIELRILDYISWILSLRYCFCFLIYIFVLLLINLLVFVFIKNVYWILKFHRHKFCFLNIFSLFILAPPDILLQFFIILFCFIFYEIIFFIICYKIYNNKAQN